MKEEILPGVALVDLAQISDRGSTLIVAEEGAHIPFAARRVFVVRDVDHGALRGEHTHASCTEILVCIAGAVEITLFDGTTEKTVMLSSPARGLVIPPLVWSTQRYVAPGSILMVLCDEVYDADEYIRDYDDFLRRVVARGGVGKSGNSH